MSTRTKQIGIAAAAAMLVALMGTPTARAHDADRSASSGSYRPQPSQNEQTGMSWLEYFTCVRTVQAQMGSWSYATQECADQKPDDPPEPPVRVGDGHKAAPTTATRSDK